MRFERRYIFQAERIDMEFALILFLVCFFFVVVVVVVVFSF